MYWAESTKIENIVLLRLNTESTPLMIASFVLDFN